MRRAKYMWIHKELALVIDNHRRKNYLRSNVEASENIAKIIRDLEMKELRRKKI